MSDTAKSHHGQQVGSWIVSFVVHGLIMLLLGFFVLAAVQEPVIEAVVQLEPVGRLDDPASESAGGSAPNAQNTSQTTSSPTTAPLPAPDLASTVGAQPTPESFAELSDPSATDPALALLSELRTEMSAQHSGQGDNPLIDGTSPGFQEMIGGIQGRGLDVVFVIDATESMAGIMQQAKERMHDVIGVITGVLTKDGQPPRNIRFGVVAFKDYGDDYGLDAVKVLTLTNDFVEVRTFIDELHTSGGGDEPEPIHEALAVAIDKRMGWRNRAKNIIVLIGDAPVHPGGRSDVGKAARLFVSKYNGTINVIDVATDRNSVLGDFTAIAKEGQGTATLLANQDAFWEDLVVSIFGTRFERDVRTIVERYAKSNRY